MQVQVRVSRPLTCCFLLRYLLAHVHRVPPSYLTLLMEVGCCFISLCVLDSYQPILLRFGHKSNVMNQKVLGAIAPAWQMWSRGGCSVITTACLLVCSRVCVSIASNLLRLRRAAFMEARCQASLFPVLCCSSREVQTLTTWMGFCWEVLAGTWGKCLRHLFGS